MSSAATHAHGALRPTAYVLPLSVALFTQERVKTQVDREEVHAHVHAHAHAHVITCSVRVYLI